VLLLLSEQLPSAGVFAGLDSRAKNRISNDPLAQGAVGFLNEVVSYRLSAISNQDDATPGEILLKTET